MTSKVSQLARVATAGDGRSDFERLLAQRRHEVGVPRRGRGAGLRRALGARPVVELEDRPWPPHRLDERGSTEAALDGYGHHPADRVPRPLDAVERARTLAHRVVIDAAGNDIAEERLDLQQIVVEPRDVAVPARPILWLAVAMRVDLRTVGGRDHREALAERAAPRPGGAHGRSCRARLVVKAREADVMEFVGDRVVELRRGLLGIDRHENRGAGLVEVDGAVRLRLDDGIDGRGELRL